MNVFPSHSSITLSLAVLPQDSLVFRAVANRANLLEIFALKGNFSSLSLSTGQALAQSFIIMAVGMYSDKR